MNARKVVVDVLNEVFFKNSYSNISLNKALKNSNLASSDKALVTEIVYGTIKYKYTIDIILKKFIKVKFSKLDKIILNILRSSVYQIRYLDRIPDFAVVNEGVELAKKYSSLKSSKFVNGVLRNYIRNLDADFLSSRDKIKVIAFRYSFEPWMVNFFIKQYGIENIDKILSGLNSTPNVTVRVNLLRGSYDETFNKLQELGYDIEEGSICPEAIEIKRGSSIENNPLFLKGNFTVQDESAMLTVPCMEIENDMYVMDLCSAPGGKTTHISELSNNTGTVYAFDIHKNKLKLIEQNAERLGITNIKCDVMNASEYNEKFKGKADRILVDVPCSGLGIIKKKPEIKWNKSINDLKELCGLQEKILQNASKYLKKGGILLYSTCTLNKDENENNIKRFISSHNNFKIEDIFFGDVSNVNYDKYGVTILPNEHMDGFFMCKLRKLW